jgi:hypothetical protein
MILIIILLAAFIVLKIITDFGYIEHNSFLWHSADAANRVVLFGYISIQYFGFNHKAYSITALCLLIFWIIFDIGINLRRHLDFYYVGSGTMDLIVRKIAFKLRMPAESLMFICKFIAFDLVIFYLAEAFK